MNKITQWLLSFILAVTLITCPIADNSYAKTAYQKTALTGGTATALDGINGSALSDGDFAYVMENGQSYIYVLDADLNLATASPKYIRPTTNAGTKTWVLQNTLPDKPLTNLLTNSGFGVWSNSTLENVGSDLVTNGGFDSDTTGWTVGNGTGTSVAGGTSGNCIKLTPSAGSSVYATQAITTVIGKLYKVIAYYKNGTSSSLRLYIGTISNGSEIHSSGLIGNASWTAYSVVFEATATTTYITVQNAGSAGTTGYWDTISNYEVTPGCVAADALALDGWYKNSALDIWREHNGSNTKEGSFYALKLNAATATHNLIWPLSTLGTTSSFYKKFSGKTVTFGCWVKTSTATHIRLSINDGLTATNSSYHTGGGSYEWIEVTKDVSLSATAFYVSIWVQATGVDGYISQPMLIFGSSIGAGNYAPKPDEIIWAEAEIGYTAFDNVTGFSDVSATTSNVEANTSGKVPKGAKAIYVSMRTNDSGSAGTDCSMSIGPSSSVSSLIASPAGLANDMKSKTQGWISLDANGDFSYTIDATGSGTFDITRFKILGVQLQ